MGCSTRRNAEGRCSRLARLLQGAAEVGRSPGMNEQTKRSDSAAQVGRRRFLEGAAWTAGAVATGAGSWVIPASPSWAADADQGRHRHRPHRRDRLCRKLQSQRRQALRLADQQVGRPARPPGTAVCRRHRLERGGGRCQCAPADRARPCRCRTGRDRQLDAQCDQGSDRAARSYALHLPGVLRGQGMREADLLHRPDAGAAMRPAHPVADQERRQAVRPARRPTTSGPMY